MIYYLIIIRMGYFGNKISWLAGRIVEVNWNDADFELGDVCALDDFVRCGAVITCIGQTDMRLAKVMLFVP